ncbi:hypothetical protein HDU76_010565 [Blyttiomyces sp. JEL0837]|nr:hypothetical protein HDU76_010565 [Blyttiomyces sp. JEL0837]
MTSEEQQQLQQHEQEQGPSLLMVVATTDEGSTSIPSTYTNNYNHKIIDKLSAIFPVLTWLPFYDWKKSFAQDLMAGLSISTLVVPQAMAYAVLASLPPVYGLYTSIFPILVYFVMGTSPHQNIGTFAVVAMMLSDTCSATQRWVQAQLPNDPPSYNDTLEDDGLDVDWDPPTQDMNLYIQIVMLYTVSVGLFQLALWSLGVGAQLARILPDELISGFTTSSGISIATSQLKHLFGISPGQFMGPLSLPRTWVAIVYSVRKANPVTVGLSAVSLGVMMAIQKLEVGVRGRVADGNMRLDSSWWGRLWTWRGDRNGKNSDRGRNWAVLGDESVRSDLEARSSIESNVQKTATVLPVQEGETDEGDVSPFIPSVTANFASADALPLDASNTHETVPAVADNVAQPVMENCGIERTTDINASGKSTEPEAAPKKKSPTPITDVLLTIIILSIFSGAFNIHSLYGVNVIGPIPSGFPEPSVPWRMLFTLPRDKVSLLLLQLIPGVLTLSVVCFVTTYSISMTFAKPKDEEPGSTGNLNTTENRDVAYQPTPERDGADQSPTKSAISATTTLNASAVVDAHEPKDDTASSIQANQDLLALATATIIGSFFGAHVPSGSLSRSAVLASQTDVKSLLNSLVSVSVVSMYPKYQAEFVQRRYEGVGVRNSRDRRCSTLDTVLEVNEEQRLTGGHVGEGEGDHEFEVDVEVGGDSGNVIRDGSRDRDGDVEGGRGGVNGDYGKDREMQPSSRSRSRSRSRRNSAESGKKVASPVPGTPELGKGVTMVPAVVDIAVGGISNRGMSRVNTEESHGTGMDGQNSTTWLHGGVGNASANALADASGSGSGGGVASPRSFLRRSRSQGRLRRENERVAELLEVYSCPMIWWATFAGVVLLDSGSGIILGVIVVLAFNLSIWALKRGIDS